MKNLKHSIVLLFLLSFGMYTSAQNSTKYGFELREYVKTAEVNENVPLLVEGDEQQIKQLTEQLGGTVRLQFESLFSLEIPAQNVSVFAESAAVKTSNSQQLQVVHFQIPCWCIPMWTQLFSKQHRYDKPTRLKESF